MIGAPDVLAEAGALTLPPGLARKLERETAAGRRVVAFGESGGALPADAAAAPPPRLAPLALVVLEETLRPDAAETIAFMREQEVDLKLISGDARATVTAVAYAVGVPREAGVVEGSELPEDPEELARVALANTIFCRIKPEQKKALVGALVGAGRYVAMIGDGVNDVPALKRARMAVAMGSGTQVTKGVADVVLLEDQFSRLPEAVGEGRRIARNIHRLGRLYLTKTVYAAALILLVAVPGLRLPLPPPPPHPGGAADDRHPLLRARPRPLRRAALPRPAAAGAGRLRGPGRAGDGDRLDPLLLPRRHRRRRPASTPGGPRRRRR